MTALVEKQKAGLDIPFRNTMRANFTLQTSISVIVLATLLVVLSIWQSTSAINSQVKSRLETVGSLEAQIIRTSLESRLSELRMLALQGDIQSLQPDRVMADLTTALKELNIYETLFVAGTEGVSVADTTGKAGMDLSQRDYYQKALQGEEYISDIMVSRGTGNLVLVFAVPLRADGKVIGMVAGSVNTQKIQAALQSAETGETGEAYLLNQQGMFMTGSRFTPLLQKMGLVKERAEMELQDQSQAAQLAIAGQSGVLDYTDYRSQPVLGAYAPVQVANARLAVIAKVDESEAQADVSRLRNLMILVGVVMGLAMSGVVYLVSKRTTQPLGLIAYALSKMANGDLNRDIPLEVKNQLKARKDEVGTMATALVASENYFIALAGLAERIAAGDLTTDIEPKSEKDELGQALVKMSDRLNDVVSEIANSAGTLSAASAQLFNAANQAGQASSQIAQTIQQVAQGAAQQTDSVSRTVASVEQMGRAIEGVTRGAHEQSRAVQTVSNVTHQITSAIQQVSGNAQTGADESARAAQVAQSGANTVQAAIQGMGSIQEKVNISAQRVQDMGGRSEQIGAIVETIEDIASQTNLLALNAAIEAARAGEHGKGFAVVADEVRKLAEKSAAATKEISGLVKDIQRTVGEAVSAMQDGSGEVERGVQQANQASQALVEILSAVRTVNLQVSEIAGAADSMHAMSREMVAAANAVSAVVEQNTSATEQMSSGSLEVGQAIESIASVSEQNSAAIEEVSASAEEMSAQVAEVTSSAQSLAEMAKGLESIVMQFKLSW